MMYTIFDEAYRLNRELDRMLRGAYSAEYRRFPEVNVYENKDEYVAVMTIPGVEKEDIALSVKENVLKISGERKKVEEKGTYYLNERRTGAFERTVLFDENIDADKVQATLQDGILMIKLAKSEDAKPKTISIN